MTIQPEHIRFAFGISVRTYDGPATPQAIIAPIFRDVGQPDTGLTPAVEEIAGAAMRKLARKEGHTGTHFPKHRPEESYLHAQMAITRRARLRKIVAIVAAQPTTRIDLVAVLGISDGQHFVDLFQLLMDDGLIVMTRCRPRSFFTITDAGRAWLAEQDATASQERPG